MEALGLSNAASPLEGKSLKRPVDASLTALAPEGAPSSALSSAPGKAAVAAKIPQQKQVIVEPLSRFSYAYTFLNSETGEVVSKWPVVAIIQPGTRIDTKL